MSSNITKNMNDVAIVLVSWNTRELVLDCLRSLPEACAGLRWEAHVVDNASTDDTVEQVAREFSSTVLTVNTDNVGFAAANNQGIAKSNARYMFLLNSDTVAQPGSITELVRFADAHPKAGIVGPRLLNTDGSFQASCCALPSLLSEVLSATGLGERLINTGYPGVAEHRCDRPMQVGYVAGAAMFARAEAVAQVGGMSTDYFMYAEEADWCWRMAKAGWETWHYPASRIIHHGGQSTRQVRKSMIRALYRSKIMMLRKTRGKTAAFILKTVVVLVWGVKWALTYPAQREPGPLVSWSDLK